MEDIFEYLVPIGIFVIWIISQIRQKDQSKGRIVGKKPREEKKTQLDEFSRQLELSPLEPASDSRRLEAQVGGRPVIPGKTTTSPFVEFLPAPRVRQAGNAIPLPHPISIPQRQPLPLTHPEPPSVEEEEPGESLEERMSEEKLSTVEEEVEKDIVELQEEISQRRVGAIEDTTIERRRRRSRKAAPLPKAAPESAREVAPLAALIAREEGLAGLAAWRRAIVMAEILGPPRAMRRTHRLF